jgi:hypothetical protein
MQKLYKLELARMNEKVKARIQGFFNGPAMTVECRDPDTGDKVCARRR